MCRQPQVCYSAYNIERLHHPAMLACTSIVAELCRSHAWTHVSSRRACRQHFIYWHYAVPLLTGITVLDILPSWWLIAQPFAAGEAAAGTNILNQPVNERMLEQLLAGEWQVTGDTFHSCIAAPKATCYFGKSIISSNQYVRSVDGKRLIKKMMWVAVCACCSRSC